MKFLLVGGGSGGHITPLLAVAKEIKLIDMDARVYAMAERHGKFNSLFVNQPQLTSVYTIYAGKLRRYHGESWLRRVLDIKTIFLNLRDAILLVLGFFESIIRLLILRPDVIFIKGGYVGVPVGFAARVLRIPYITHDSDAMPGLTNRLIGKAAKINAVGMPASNYDYPKNKMAFVGVPVGADYFSPTLDKMTDQTRSDYGVPAGSQVLLVMGGSNGAQKLDSIVSAVVEKLLHDNSRLFIIHQVGKGNENIHKSLPEQYQSRIVATRFISPLAPVVSLADVVVSRAGATAISELASLAKAVILVPSPDLAGGHQLKNAKAFSDQQAAISLDEALLIDDPSILLATLEKLLNNPADAKKLGQTLNSVTELGAASKIADLLTKTVRNHRK